MILYFISRLLIIGSEANYENKLKDIDFSDAKQMFGYAILAVINYIISCCPERKKQNIKDSTKEDKQPFTDEYFIELFFISIGFNCLIGFVYSIFVLFFDYDDETFICGFNVTINAFFVFLLNYYCLIITKINIDLDFLFPQTILISFYFIILDYIIYLIKLLLNDINNMFYFQFIIGGILTSLIIILLIIGCCCAFKECCCS